MSLDRRELLNDGQEALRLAMEGRLSSVWTALVGLVQSVDYTKRTCTVQPSIQGRVQLPSGQYQYVNLPVLVDVPIVFPSAGGFTLSLPLAAGDEVLVVFASRCIDSWWQSGGIGLPMESRMHDLSDGFAIPGPRSLATTTPLSATNAQLTSDDGETYIELTPSGNVNVKATIFNVEATTINMEATDLNFEGNLTVDGNIVADELTVGAVPFSTHRHSTATNPSGPPVP